MIIGKTYMVVGAFGEIGTAVMNELSARGANLVLVDLEGADASRLQLVSGTVNTVIAADLSREGAASAIASELEHKGIMLDGMVYCVGISPLSLLENTTGELTSRVFQLNLFAFIELMTVLTEEKYMNEGSSVIALSSIVALKGSRQQLLYGTSKAALNAAVKNMAVSLLPRKISVNSLMMSPVLSEMYQKICEKDPEIDKKNRYKYPLGIIPPAYIANYIAFLVDGGDRFITGQSIPIDAGGLLF